MGEEIGVPWDAIIVGCLSVLYALYCMLGNLYADEIGDVLVYVIYAITLISSSLFGWILTRRLDGD